MEIDFIVFSQLFILFLFFYTNLNLKKATYEHQVQSINQWLIINSIFFIFFNVYVGFTTIRNSTPEIIPIGIPVSIVVVYQIYVVKSFYDDELKLLAISEQNQSGLHGSPYVTITNQPIQSTAAYPVQSATTYPIQSTTAYPIQSGPYVIQQLHQPIAQVPYPQQTFQFQQQQTQANHIYPPQEPHTPQEYCNPPPYSPNCNMQEGSSMKQ
jgi:hypothetical protein